MRLFGAAVGFGIGGAQGEPAKRHCGDGADCGESQIP
jgi:hypothetical protein